MSDITEGSAIADEVVVELVKGPDPDEWGDDQTIPAEPATPATVDDLPEGVKGPDPTKWGHVQAGLPDPVE